jgi:hypothetical protein
MKRVLLSILLVAGVHGAALAQNGNLALGLKAGASLSSLVGPDAAFKENFFGFHTGIFANLSLSNHIAFQPELLYSQKGGRPQIRNNDDVALRLHYVDVPLALHVNVGGLFFEAGPQVGFLAGARLKVNNTYTDVKESYNTVDAGYLAGLGYQRKSGLGVGLRYNGGITNIKKEATVGSITYQDRARNSVFQLYLTYSLNAR